MFNYLTISMTFSKPVRKMLAAQGFLGVGMGIFQVLLNLYFKEIGFGEDLIGRLLAFQSLCAAVASVPMGWLADATSRRTTYLVGIGFVISGLGLVTVAETVIPIFLACLISGVGSGAIMVSVQPFLQENSRKRQRPYLFSLNFSVTLVMNIFAGLLAGWLPGAVSRMYPGHLQPVLQGLKGAMSVGIGFLILAALPARRLPSSEKRTQERPAPSAGPGSVAVEKAPVPLRVIAKFVIPTAFIGAGAGMIVPYFNLYFRDWVGASIAQIGYVFALGQLATAIGGISSPWLSRRVGLANGVVLTEGLSLPFMLLMAWTHDLYLCTTCFLFRGALMNMGTPMRQELLMETIHPAYRARASAAESVGWNLTWAASMFFSGSLIRTMGYGSCLYITFACYLVASGLYWYFFSYQLPRGKL